MIIGSQSSERAKVDFSFLSFPFHIDSRHRSLLSELPGPISISPLCTPKRTSPYSMSDKQRSFLPGLQSPSTVTDRQMPTAISLDRQTDSHYSQAPSCGTGWVSILVLFLAANSFAFWVVLFYLSFSSAFGFPPSCLLIPEAFAMTTWRVFFFFFTLWRV